jgi:hypothetical protein
VVLGGCQNRRSGELPSCPWAWMVTSLTCGLGFDSWSFQIMLVSSWTTAILQDGCWKTRLPPYSPWSSQIPPCHYTCPNPASFPFFSMRYELEFSFPDQCTTVRWQLKWIKAFHTQRWSSGFTETHVLSEGKTLVQGKENKPLKQNCMRKHVRSPM